MAKSKNESTAINDLINLVNTATPLPPDPDEDLMFADPKRRAPAKNHAVSVPRMSATVPTLKVGAEVAPLPRARGAQGTGENVVAPQVRVSTAPPSRQTTIPPLAEPATGSAPFTMNNRFDLSATSSVGHNIPASSIGITLPAAPLPRPSTAKSDLDEPTFDFDEAPASRHEETWVGTVHTPKTATTMQWVGRLAPIAGAMIVIGIFVGGYVAFDGEGGHGRAAAGATVAMPAPATTTPAAAPATVAAPATTQESAKTEEPVAAKTEEPVAAKTEEPAPAVAAPVTATAARPVFTDVRIDSNPPGATVTLIDRGKRMFIGSTPISTSVDVSRQYEVELVYGNRPAVIQPLDPTSTKKLSVEIHRAKTAAVAPTEVAPPIAAPAPKKVAAATETPKVEAPKEAAPKDETPKAEPAAAAPAATGILMISSKPPCEILIDGKPTGLTTPQRSLPLSVGTHKVTLVNAAEKLKKTLTIQISPDQPTKVIQDLMN